MEQFTKEQLEALKTPELVKLYNKHSSKKVKRFESRKVAVQKILQLISDHAAKVASLPTGTVRTVRKLNTSKAGRPTLEFSVTACAEGASEVREDSLRGQIMKFIKEQADATATIAALESKFGDKVRGAVQKLIAVKWLKRNEPAAAA